MNHFFDTEWALEQFGNSLAKSLRSGDVIFLQGNVGTGKTTISRGILRGFGYEGVVVSPTYTLIETYDLKFYRIAHFDLYRIDNPQDLESIGYRDFFDGETICLI